MKYVATAVLLLLLAGCGGDPQPTFSPSPTVSSSATTTAAAGETPQEFLRRWYRVSDRMELTGRTDVFDGLHTKACNDCETYAASVRGTYETGRHIAGTDTTVLAVRHLRDDLWLVDSRAAATQVLDRHGGVVGRFPGGLETFRIGLSKRAGGWRVSSMVRLAAAE